MLLIHNYFLHFLHKAEYLDLINNYTQYDEQSDAWQIKYIALSGNNTSVQMNVEAHGL